MDKLQLSWFTSDNLVDTYIMTYFEQYGIEKNVEIISKINSSKKVHDFIQRLRSEKLHPGESGFFKTVFSIPYFLFSKGETLGLGTLLAIQKWEQLSENDSYKFDYKVIKEIMISSIFQAQKLKLNLSNKQSFFDKYFIRLRSIYVKPLFDPSEEIEGFYYSEKDGNKLTSLDSIRIKQLCNLQWSVFRESYQFYLRLLIK